MFVEFTDCDEKKLPILINPEHVTCVTEQTLHREIHVVSGRVFWVSENFEEVKKRLGLSISPRAETLIKNVA